MPPQIEILKFPEYNQIRITHRYNRDIETLWDAFTKTEILERWWAPEPFKAVVVEYTFVPGGKLFYYMASPTGEKHYCSTQFLDIDPLRAYSVLDAFCDENGQIIAGFPRMQWDNAFTRQDDQTVITNIIHFQNAEEMAQLLEMGFEAGYTLALNQLYELLEKGE